MSAQAEASRPTTVKIHQLRTALAAARILLRYLRRRDVVAGILLSAGVAWFIPFPSVETTLLAVIKAVIAEPRDAETVGIYARSIFIAQVAWGYIITLRFQWDSLSPPGRLVPALLHRTLGMSIPAGGISAVICAIPAFLADDAALAAGVATTALFFFVLPALCIRAARAVLFYPLLLALGTFLLTPRIISAPLVAYPLLTGFLLLIPGVATLHWFVHRADSGVPEPSAGEPHSASGALRRLVRQGSELSRADAGPLWSPGHGESLATRLVRAAFYERRRSIHLTQPLVLFGHAILLLLAIRVAYAATAAIVGPASSAIPPYHVLLLMSYGGPRTFLQPGILTRQLRTRVVFRASLIELAEVVTAIAIALCIDAALVAFGILPPYGNRGAMERNLLFQAALLAGMSLLQWGATMDPGTDGLPHIRRLGWMAGAIACAAPVALVARAAQRSFGIVVAAAFLLASIAVSQLLFYLALRWRFASRDLAPPHLREG